jgi:O-antigen ligase
MSRPEILVAPVYDPDWWRAGPPETAAPDAVRAEPVERARDGLAFWALMGFTVVLLVAPQNIVPALQPLRLGLLAAGTGLLALLLGRLGSGRPITLVNREMKVAAALLAWAVVTIPLSYWPSGSLSLLLDLYLKALAIFLLIANVVSTAGRLRTVAWGLTLMTIPMAVTGVTNSLTGVYVQGGIGQAVKRIVGYDAPLTQNPNDLALVLNLVIPLTIALFLITRSPLLRAGLLGVLGLQVMGVVVTFSRAGFLALAATLVVSALTAARRLERRWAWGLLILAIACAPLLPTDYVSRLFTITDVDADPTGSAQGRWDQQAAAVGYVLSHPIVGAGLGQNILALNEVLGPQWLLVHNVYLQYAIDLGLPGLALYLLLLTGSVRNAGRAARASADRPDGPALGALANGIRTGLLAFAVAAFFSPVAYHFHFYYLAGLAMAARAIAEGGGFPAEGERSLAEGER